MDKERVPAPDLARGIMLAFIALANSALFLYGREYGVRQRIADGGVLDSAVDSLLVSLVDGRAYPLFAALFGYGMVQFARTGPVSALRRRSVVLLAFGAVHGILLFPGDVLGTYGLLGLALAGLLRASGRRLVTIAAWSLVPTALVVGAIHGSYPDDPAQRGHLWSLAITDPWQAFGWRVVEWPMTPFAMLGVVPAALVGVLAARRGVLDRPLLYAGTLKRWAFHGIWIGVAGGLPMAAAAAGWWHPQPLVLLAASALHTVTGVAAGLGYAALIGRLRLPGRLGRALRACGRRSLTCYLLQSVVFVLLLSGNGLGLGAHLTALPTALLALATWAATVLLADLLRRHDLRGPAEVLLRHLSRRRIEAAQ